MLVAAGRRLASASGASLRRLLEVVDKAKALVEPCCLPGGLPCAASHEDSHTRADDTRNLHSPDN